MREAEQEASTGKRKYLPKPESAHEKTFLQHEKKSRSLNRKRGGKRNQAEDDSRVFPARRGNRVNGMGEK